MDIDRRSLMKGMLAGSALLALGVPPWTFAESAGGRPKRCMLWLGGTCVDDKIANGAEAACKAATRGDLQVVRQKGGLLNGTDEVVRLLEQSQGARCIAVMDDASAAIFRELIRTAGEHVISIGTHACSPESVWPHRHVWTTTSQACGMGGLLASRYSQGQETFLITERFLQAPSETHPLKSWSGPGFSSYRSDEGRAIHLHCSGISAPNGGWALGLSTSEKWMPMPSQANEPDCVPWQSENWAESVGYVVTALTLGGDVVQESCSNRAFIQQSQTPKRDLQTERFVSFVLDL
ncbi:MAG: hypothetical protein ABI618_03130 [Nitrospirota bacterium]